MARSMPRTPLIVIGASAGGIEALRRLTPTLPSDLPAAVAIVVHRQPVEEDERLPRVLSKDAALRVTHARDGEVIHPGQVVVAPANVHLKVNDGAFTLDPGPRENNSRPAIDVLFRSAACAYGPAVAGVLLSGMLDDGTAGLAEIQRHGGMTIVQDPQDALFGDMPRNALTDVSVDVVAPIEDMAKIFIDFAKRAPLANNGVASVAQRDRPSGFSCPECGGVLWNVKDEYVDRYRCRTGHAYTPVALHQQQRVSLEESLWAAIRALEEHREMSLRLASSMRSRGLIQRARQLEREARADLRRADVVRSALPTAREAREEGNKESESA